MFVGQAGVFAGSVSVRDSLSSFSLRYVATSSTSEASFHDGHPGAHSRDDGLRPNCSSSGNSRGPLFSSLYNM